MRKKDHKRWQKNGRSKGLFSLIPLYFHLYQQLKETQNMTRKKKMQDIFFFSRRVFFLYLSMQKTSHTRARERVYRDYKREKRG